MKRVVQSKDKASNKPFRKVYLDAIRIIAIYMVLFTHTNTAGNMLFTVSRDSPFYFFYLMNSVFIKMSVTLFFMISGALLLHKNETFEKIIKHKFVKFLIALVAASLITYIYLGTRSDYYSELSIGNFVRTIYTGQITAAYWYLYSYLGFLLMLPLLRKMAQNMTDKEFIYIFCIAILMSVLPIIDYLIWKGAYRHNGNFSVILSTNLIVWPLAGYFIEHRIKTSDFNKKNMIVLTLVCLVSMLICCFMVEYQYACMGEGQGYQFMDSFVTIQASTVFYGVKMLFMKYPFSERACRLISQIGGLTFGIYLFEHIYRQETEFIYEKLQPVLHSLPACWIWILCACILGGVVTFVLKKIPVIKRFL